MWNRFMNLLGRRWYKSGSCNIDVNSVCLIKGHVVYSPEGDEPPAGSRMSGLDTETANKVWSLLWISSTNRGGILPGPGRKGMPSFLSHHTFSSFSFLPANVSVCFMPIEVLPSFYRYGYAMPFYNVSLAVRTILFGTKNEVGIHFVILIAWAALSCITLPTFQWYRRRVLKKADEE